MQALTQLIVEVADRGRGVVDVEQIGTLDIFRRTREQVLKGVTGVVFHICDVVLEAVHQWC